MEILREEVLNEIVGGMNTNEHEYTMGDKVYLITNGYVHGLCTGLSGIYHGLAVREKAIPIKYDGIEGDSKAQMLNGCGCIAGGGTNLLLAAYGAYKLGEKIVKKIL